MKTSSLSSLSTIWVGEQSNLDVYSAKILREILCPNCGQAKFSHPAHYIPPHLHLSVTLHMGGGAERTKYAHQQWTRQAHCAHQVLTAELWKFLPFACYEIWMHLSRNHKWNPSKNQAFSWLKSTAITIESLQVEVKKICHRSVY